MNRTPPDNSRRRITPATPAEPAAPFVEIDPADYAAGLKVELDRAIDELAKARGAVFAQRRRIAELEALVREDGAKLAALAGRLGDELDPEALEELGEVVAGNGAGAVPAELVTAPDDEPAG